jgi:hypothetical protein
MMTLALMLSAGSAYAFGGPGSVVVDIVGSTTDNTRVTTSGPQSVDLEVIGSDANNTIIAPPEKKAVVCCPQYICPDIDQGCQQCGGCQGQKRVYPWEDMHLGVDAWYGTFWYTDINMPKWPQF